MTYNIYEFLEGAGTDHRSRRIEDILAFDDGDLEAVHDYIQWLFPLPESSAFTPFAPILSSQDIAELKASSIVRRNLLVAATRMLGFYEKNTHWLTAINHNHLRITRIIRSLAILVDPDKAQWFHSEIEKLVTAAGGPVRQEALDYWRGAVQAGALTAPRTTTD